MSYLGNTLIPLYDNEDAVCGIIYNNTPYYFIKNLQGDVIAITNKNAAVVAKYSYDAWGVPTIISDTSGIGIASINPFRYRSYYYDTETQLYYLQSRYYDPVVGRFINSDDTSYLNPRNINGINLYSYCANNPTMLKQSTNSYGGSITLSSILPKVNWENSGFQIPIWVSSLISGLDFSTSIAPALRTYISMLFIQE